MFSCYLSGCTSEAEAPEAVGGSRGSFLRRGEGDLRSGEVAVLHRDEFYSDCSQGRVIFGYAGGDVGGSFFGDEGAHSPYENSPGCEVVSWWGEEHVRLLESSEVNGVKEALYGLGTAEQQLRESIIVEYDVQGCNIGCSGDQIRYL